MTEDEQAEMIALASIVLGGPFRAPETEWEWRCLHDFLVFHESDRFDFQKWQAKQRRAFEAELACLDDLEIAKPR